MVIKIKYLSALIVAFFFLENVHGQYFVSEVDPVYLKWKKITDKTKGDIIFPDYVLDKALAISFYRDTLFRFIDYNIDAKFRRFPITLHPTNMLSNGMVTYTPQRMELYTMPTRDNYSLPWLKQLVAHEYRHVAQLSNLNQGITRALSYVIGEQMLGLTAILIPTYFYEGDAVVAETEFAIFGRGKQPSFNTPLRAAIIEGRDYSARKYKLGAINQFTPDPYLLGFHLTQYATEKFGDDFWSKVLRFGARNPYLIDPCFFAYRKYGNKMNSAKMIDSTVNRLREFWRENSLIENSSHVIPTKITSYTSYSYPIQINDTMIVAHKSDFDRAGRFVSVNPNDGAESVLANTGTISSPPFLKGRKIYWNEIVPSLSWGQKNSSSLFCMELKGSRVSTPRRIRKLKGNYFFFTTYANDGFVAVEYDKENNPHIVLFDEKFNVVKSHAVEGDDISFNGLAFDSVTNGIYGVIVDNRGTSVVKVDAQTGEPQNVMPSNYGTITNLSATDGKLYYTSINSGKEEVHIFNLQGGKEYQLTTSSYGSQAAAPAGDYVLMTTYGADGYLLARQKIDGLKESHWRKIPSEELCYPYKKWNVGKMDTIHFTPDVKTKYEKTKTIKKYNKALHSVHVHSWLPFYLDVNKIIDDRELSGGFGVNVLSQNLLNSVIASAGYGWVNGASIWKANLKYVGLPVHLAVDFENGGGKQQTYNFLQIGGKRKDYLNVTGELSLPLNLSSGGNNRFLKMGVFYEYENGILYKSLSPRLNIIGGTDNLSMPLSYSKSSFINGIHRTEATITYQNTLKTARKALNPRWGYILQLSNTMSPFNGDFGNILFAYGRAYLPGPFLHGSFTVEAASQYQTEALYHYNQTILRPRGVDYQSTIRKSYSTSVDYRVPIVYPNGGIGAFMNFQRISVAGFVDYSHYQTFYSKKWYNANSYGGSVIVDVNLLGISNLFNVEMSLYRPSDKKKVMFEMGFNLSF